jgi:hypothetical protein
MTFRRSYYAIVAAAWIAFAASVVHAFGQDAGQAPGQAAGSPAGAPAAGTSSAPTTVPAAAPQDFTLTVNADDLATINQGLQGMSPPPFGKVAPLMQKLQAQIVRQQAAQGGAQGGNAAANAPQAGSAPGAASVPERK